MKNRIFRGIFIVAILVWVACLTLIMGALYLQYTGQDSRELKNEATLVASGINTGGEDFLDDVKVAENHRITLVKSDGTVLFDSAADAQALDSHSDRPEITQALQTGYGEATRYSKTLAEKTMYSAVRLDDGNVVRVSRVDFTIVTLILSMLQPILLVLVLAVVVSLILASRIAKRIVEPVNRIDPENPLKFIAYEEFRPLVEKIDEQNRELNSRIDRLQIDVDERTKESDFRKEFTANVSHELKTPLTSISGFAELIKNNMVKEEDIPRFAGRIYDEAQRLITLVGDIIKLSQLDERQITAKKERIDLLSMCQSAAELLKIPAAEKNITVNISGKPVFVIGVEKILEEIIYNLCDNAVKYNKANGEVSINVFEQNGRPSVKVSDTGIGIPPEDMDRVFERFYRVNKSHSKEIGGTGLGLSIVKHGVAFHGGEIKIESQINCGTSITVIFDK